MSTGPSSAGPPDAPGADGGLDVSEELDADADTEEALRWDGDEADRRIARPASRPAAADGGPAAVREPGGSAAGLVAFGVVAGLLLLEAVGWLRAVLGPLSATIDAGSGSLAELISFALNIVVRATAVAAAPVWLGFVLWRVPAGARRVAALTIGVLVLIPWPALVHA